MNCLSLPRKVPSTVPSGESAPRALLAEVQETLQDHPEPVEFVVSSTQGWLCEALGKSTSRLNQLRPCPSPKEQPGRWSTLGHESGQEPPA